MASDSIVLGSLADRAHRLLAIFALAAEATSILCSVVVVFVLRTRFARDPPQYEGSLSLVNPWYGLAAWTMVAAVAALVAWGIVGLRRPPVGHRIAGAALIGVLLAIAAVAWALSFYKRLG